MATLTTAPVQPNIVQTVGYVTTAPEEIFNAAVGNLKPRTGDDAPTAYSLPPIEPSIAPTVIENNTTVTSSPNDCTAAICIKEDKDEDSTEPLNFFQMLREPYASYRGKESSLAWIPGSGQGFGLVEGSTDPYLERGESSGFTGAMNMTWLSGPLTTPLSPRVYEISAGFQTRQHWSPLFSYDLFTSIGIFSDFDGSAREGVRFPSHAVGMLHLNSSTDMIFGADFLDRDDINVLPVFGFSIRSDQHPRFRMDLVFPRPRIDYSLSDSKRTYLSGTLGGDTWDMGDRVGLVTTYRDYRLMLGFENADDDGETSSIEFGYVFGRQMEVRGQPGATEFDDAFVLRWVTRNYPCFLIVANRSRSPKQ
jgi:hypothetical protein